MFNLQGSEIIFILLLALVVLGPEKLPGAIRRFTKTYAELRKMSSGFQTEVKSAFEEPLREVRETADLIAHTADPTAAIAEADADDDAGRAADEAAARAEQEQAAARDATADRRADPFATGSNTLGPEDGTAEGDDDASAPGEWDDPIDLPDSADAPGPAEPAVDLTPPDSGEHMSDDTVEESTS